MHFAWALEQVSFVQVTSSSQLGCAVEGQQEFSWSSLAISEERKKQLSCCAAMVSAGYDKIADIMLYQESAQAGGQI